MMILICLFHVTVSNPQGVMKQIVMSNAERVKTYQLQRKEVVSSESDYTDYVGDYMYGLCDSKFSNEGEADLAYTVVHNLDK